MKFVQKAVRLLWGGLDRVVDPHESVGRELWKGVGPADLGEMAADVEMQKAFVGKKRPRGVSFQGERERNSLVNQSLSTQRIFKSSGQPTLVDDTYIPPPPNKGLAPAPQLPSMVQDCSPNALQYIYFDSATEGHWAVQQAVQSIRDVQLWSGTPSIENRGNQHVEHHFNVNATPQQQSPIEQPQQHQETTYGAQHHQYLQYQMSHVNYENDSTQHLQEPRRISIACPPTEVQDDPALIHSNLIEFNALAQLHAYNNFSSNTQSTPFPAANHFDGMLKSMNINYGVPTMLPTRRITHAPSDASFHIVNESAVSAGLHDTIYCTNVTQQLCMQPMDQRLSGVDQKVCVILIGTIASAWFDNNLVLNLCLCQSLVALKGAMT